MVEEKTKAAQRSINAFDACILVVALLSVIGFGMAKAGHAGVNKVIQGQPNVDIDVFITGLKTKDTDLFKVNEKANITIRNVPVQPAMTITKVQHWPKQVSFLSADGKKAVAMADPANPISHDFLVTVEAEKAERTEDGFVFRGNKIKVGNQIELESFKYRVQGVVADIKEAVPEQK